MVPIASEPVYDTDEKSAHSVPDFPHNKRQIEL